MLSSFQDSSPPLRQLNIYNSRGMTSVFPVIAWDTFAFVEYSWCKLLMNVNKD